MYTIESVLKAFQRALELAKRLPPAGPQGPKNPWPDIVRLGHEGYVDNNQRVSALTAAELADYETTVSWIAFLKNESDRRILWAYAAGLPGWKIAKRCTPAVSQSTISRRIMWALGFIKVKLNLGEAPPGFEIQSPCDKVIPGSTMASPWDVLKKSG
jgi:hypothetical protein